MAVYNWSKAGMLLVCLALATRIMHSKSQTSSSWEIPRQIKMRTQDISDVQEAALFFFSFFAFVFGFFFSFYFSGKVGLLLCDMSLLLLEQKLF